MSKEKFSWKNRRRYILATFIYFVSMPILSMVSNVDAAIFGISSGAITALLASYIFAATKDDGSLREFAEDDSNTNS